MYSIPSLAVNRFWFQEAGMIIPCTEGIAPNVWLVSTRWNCEATSAHTTSEDKSG
jgi:hypothetical protein